MYIPTMIIFAVFAIMTLASGDCPTNCYCSRYKTLCSLARLKTLPTHLPNTTELLRIGLDNITQINTTIVTNSRLQNLIRLELINVNLRMIEPGAFQNMSLLEYLIINHNNIPTLETNSFKYLENLHFLNLVDNQIFYLQSGAFSGLSNLRHLDLGHNDIRNIKANIFEGMRTTNTCDIRFIRHIFSHNPRYTNTSYEILNHLCTFMYFNMLTYNEEHIPPHVASGLIVRKQRLSEFVYKYIKREISALLYLDISQTEITRIPVGSFQNYKHLTYLDASYNRIIVIENGAFQGLISLKVLKINRNEIFFIDKKSFHDLVSLKWLEMANSKIDNITFEGLSKLQVLDLSGNYINILKKDTFSSLHMLKILKLQRNLIRRIDTNAFTNLRNLKTLTNTHVHPLSCTQITKFEELKLEITGNFYNNLIWHSPWKLFNARKEMFLNLGRLDNLALTGHISLPQNMQTLNNLQLLVDARSINPWQRLHDLLQNVRYARNIDLTLIAIHSTEILTTFSEYHISKIMFLDGDFKCLNNNSLIGLTMTKSITMYVNEVSIHKEAFHDLKSLTELNLFYGSSLTYTKGSFYGLYNLKHLTIMQHSVRTTSGFIALTKLNYLYEGTFLGLDNLKRLDLTENFLIQLNPGEFQGLYSIEEIFLDHNHISTIGAGVFGALCEQEFEISCKNVTLSEYCNNTNALKTLKYLSLITNQITNVHPHAFIACTSLHTLDFSGNRLFSLSDPFLYTPGLRKLNMEFCALNNIPDNTFECTPLLSEINLNGNERLNKLTINTLIPLKHLRILDISDNCHLCDCEFYETWLWMQENKVRYITDRSTSYCNYIRNNSNYCEGKDIDQVFLNMNCNITLTEISSNKTRTVFDDYQFFKQYIEPIVLTIILISGLICNGFLLFIALRHSHMRTEQNAIIIQLTIVDVLSLILNLPLSYWDTINIIWEFDDISCKIFTFTKDMTVAVTISSIVALSIERFLAALIFKNFKKTCPSEGQPTTWLLLMTWISAIILSLPAYFSATIVEARCMFAPPGNQDYIRNVWTFQLIMYCLIPAVAIIFLNIRTSLLLRQSISKIPGVMKDNIRTKNRMMVANIMLILAVVFVISYLPNFILRVLVAWSMADMKKLFLPSFFTYCLFFFNTVFNPISIFIMSSKFKSHALSYFTFLESDQ